MLRNVSILLLALTLGCSSGFESFPADAETVPATGVPEAFRPAGNVSAASCAVTMIDPRNDAMIRLVRSAERRGDYDVAGAYGASGGQLLRLDCSTGRPIGLVRR